MFTTQFMLANGIFGYFVLKIEILLKQIRLKIISFVKFQSINGRKTVENPKIIATIMIQSSE